jgi:hyperosmotically inducible protein
MRDMLIRLEVIEKLSTEPNLAATRIDVSVRRGTVSLSGRVPRPLVRDAAVAAAWRVRGVRQVVDELFICSDGKPSDEYLARRAISLSNDLVGPADTVTIAVQDGWILLTGRTASRFAKAAVGDALRGLPGVAGVVNMVEAGALPRPTLPDPMDP